MTHMIRTTRFDGAGITLAADVAGPAGAPAVLFMHGGGQTRQSWGQAVLMAVRRGYQGIAIDLRGHGDSDWASDRNYRLDRFAEDARRVIAQVDAPVAIVGASLGGMAGLLVSGSDDAPNAGLVLVDVVPKLETEGVAEVARFMRAAPQGFASVEEAAEAVAAYQPQRKRRPAGPGLMKNLRLKADGRYHWHWDPAFIDPDLSPDPGPFQDALDAATRKVAVPLLLIRGGLSRVVSREGAEAFLKLVPDGEFVDVADAGHMVAGDENDAFSVAIFDFLGRRVFGGRSS